MPISLAPPPAAASALALILASALGPGVPPGPVGAGATAGQGRPAAGPRARADDAVAACADNLKRIARALEDYKAAHGAYPAAAPVGPDGRTRHSWRVAILPYLGDTPLHRAYRFDEPWDGPNNLKLVDRMPATYRDPSDVTSKPGVSSYSVPTGPLTAFPPGRAAGMKPAEILDGAESTILVLEVRRDAPWTKPEDVPYAFDGPVPALGGAHAGGSHALFADGAVRFLRRDLNQATLRALLTATAGDVVAPGSF